MNLKPCHLKGIYKYDSKKSYTISIAVEGLISASFSKHTQSRFGMEKKGKTRKEKRNIVEFWFMCFVGKKAIMAVQRSQSSEGVFRENCVFMFVTSLIVSEPTTFSFDFRSCVLNFPPHKHSYLNSQIITVYFRSLRRVRRNIYEHAKSGGK